MLKPYITIKFGNGELWAVPAATIAAHRAHYYSKKDPDTTYAEEFEFTVNDDYELTDWFANNMNWSDVKPVAQLLIDPLPFDYESDFVNAEKDVIR